MTAPINIDAAWLAAHPAPYQLATANATYVFGVDVKTAATGFVVAASGITLDLNGHGVTYDTQAPLVFPNGGFETGDFEGWDVSAMPHVSVASTSVLPGLWGGYCAKFTAPASATPVKETMVSGPVAIPTAGITYEGMITVKGAPSNFATTITLSVLDDSTGAVLGSHTQSVANVDNGPTLVVPFTPTTTNSVRLKLDITPPLNKPCTIYIDAASVDRTAAYGVSIGWHCNGFRLTSSRPGGKIVQGGGTARADCINAITANTGLTIDNVMLSASGRDSQIVYANYYRDVAIRNTAFAAGVDFFSNRQAAMAMCRLLQVKGAVIVEDNTFDGSYQNCVSVNGDVDYLTAMTSVSIKRNTIRHDARWGDSYGIGIERACNFEMSENVIRPIAGRGIILQGDIRGTTQLNLVGGTIHDNDIVVQERANLETGTAINATALRMRNYGGRFENVEIYKNSCVARIGTAPGMSQFCCGFKPSFYNDKGQMNGANLVIRDNYFKGVVVDASKCPANFKAYGATFAQVDPGCGVTYLRNRFESNQRPINFGDSDGINESDITLEGSILVKSTDGDPSVLPGFRAINAGGWGSKIANVKMLGTLVEGGADLTPNLEGTGTKDLVITAATDPVPVDPSPVEGAAVIEISCDVTAEGSVSDPDVEGGAVIDIACDVAAEGKARWRFLVYDPVPY